MATVDIKMPDDFLIKISRIGSAYDSIAEKTLQAGGAVILKKTKSNLASVVGAGTKEESRSTGELESSLGLSPVFQDGHGDHNIKIGFNEPRRHQVAAKGKRSYKSSTNAMIANVLEYGKHGQPAKPFLGPARRTSRKETIAVMERAFEEEVKKR